MKKLLLITILSCFIFSCENNTTDLVIGSTLGNNGESSEIVVGDTSNQQVWIDYIDAHNERDLDKISEINTEDWIGYAPNGNVVRGNEAHIAFLDEWFKSPANPNWRVKWMIANRGENDEGTMVEFLTTRYIVNHMGSRIDSLFSNCTSKSINRNYNIWESF